jgi:hypothetical protein|tara:strand:+ start:99 stop:236 length:138 start_codon:yes stop_codon:yes gene_type:complete
VKTELNSGNGKALGLLRYNSIFCWGALSFEVDGAFLLPLIGFYGD